MNGQHILANFYNCDFDFSTEQSLVEFCRKACLDSGLTVLGANFHTFNPQGITFVILLAESHLSVHTWPEHKSIAFDLYVCNHSKDNSAISQQVYKSIISHLKPERIDEHIIERSDLFKTK